MDKDKFLKLLKQKEVQNYTFNITFFVVFSFFLIFAIRPNFVTAFSLQKELQDLKLQNKKSEEVILQVVNYQSRLEEYRDKIPLLDQAVPSGPTVGQVVDQVRKSASDSGILISVVSVESIDLKRSTSDGGQGSAALDEQKPMSAVDTSGGNVDTGTTTADNPTSSADEAGVNGTPMNVGTSTTEQAFSQKEKNLKTFTITVSGFAGINEVNAFLNTLMNQRRLKKIDTVSLSQGKDGTTSILITIYYL